MADGEGGGGIMNHKIAGIPTLLIVGGIAIIAYFIFFRNSQAGTALPTTTGGGGAITMGNTTIDKGAVSVTVSQGGVHTGSHRPPPVKGGKPPPKGKPHKCPKGHFWDPDANGGKGKCVKHKENPPDSTSATNSPVTANSQVPPGTTPESGHGQGGAPQPQNPARHQVRKVTHSWRETGIPMKFPK